MNLKFDDTFVYILCGPTSNYELSANTSKKQLKNVIWIMHIHAGIYFFLHLQRFVSV